MKSGTINKIIIGTDVCLDIEAFELMKKHLLTQNDRSVGVEKGKCRYRGFAFSKIDKRFDEITDSLKEIYGDEYYNSTKWDFDQVMDMIDANNDFSEYDSMCAVGCLIDDEFYYPKLEDTPATQSSVLEVLKKSNPNWTITQNSQHMLETIQELHDSISVSAWAEGLEIIGSCFNDDGSFNNEQYRDLIEDEY